LPRDDGAAGPVGDHGGTALSAHRIAHGGAVGRPLRARGSGAEEGNQENQSGNPLPSDTHHDEPHRTTCSRILNSIRISAAEPRGQSVRYGPRTTILRIARFLSACTSRKYRPLSTLRPAAWRFHVTRCSPAEAGPSRSTLTSRPRASSTRAVKRSA